MIEQFFSILFIFGFITVLGYALQRFNEPSFPNRDTLPRTLVPLRYLFLKSAYPKARTAYVVVLLLIYVLLVASGPYVIAALKKIGYKDLTPETWALAVALIITGVSAAPPALKWLNKAEELIRRWVHTWFLVPDGVKRTVGILEDADYEPPQLQLNSVASPLKQQIQDDLKLPRTSLRYRWARASMLMQVLKQMGAGGTPLLRTANFRPFRDDFEEILKSYKAVRQDIADIRGEISEEREEKLIAEVDSLLRAIYAYISWGVRGQAERQHDVDEPLKKLGFQIPDLGERRLFDIMAWPVVFLAGGTMVFYLAVKAMLQGQNWGVVLAALESATAATIMYGWVVKIALKQRSAQIEHKVWRHGSPRRLVPIAARAGFTTWAVIVATTVVLSFPTTFLSVVAFGEAVKTLSFPAITDPDGVSWGFLPIKIATAFPWVVVGAAASVILAYFLGGDIRRTNRIQRIRDAALLGLGLALAAATALLIQKTFAVALGGKSVPITDLPVESLAGFLCGGLIGFTVPAAYRTNLMTPQDPKMARALRELRREAEARLGEPDAENWLFTPHPDLHGITPAEAVQYEGLATGVLDLLPGEARSASGPGASDSGGRGVPIVVDRNNVRSDQTIPMLIDASEVSTSPESARAASDEVNAASQSEPTTSDEVNPQPS